MLVSSKHMILASSVFKAMLQGGRFKEGQELATSTDPIKIPLPDDDVDAFTTLAYITHGHRYKVPETIKASKLLKFAILVDKYQMHKMTSLLSKPWVAKSFKY
jgi:hypothetical protein